MAQLDLEEICEKELEILSQIYGLPGEFSDLREGNNYDEKKCYIPPQINFKLGPQESRSVRQQSHEYTGMVKKDNLWPTKMMLQGVRIINPTFIIIFCSSNFI